jgi:cell division protein ZapA
MVTIGGRSYRLQCAEGEETHLEQLGGFVDGKIDEMRKSFGEIGDQRIVVMAALSLADELFEMRRKVETRATDLDKALDAEKSAREAADIRLAALEKEIGEMTARVELLARGLTERLEE